MSWIIALEDKSIFLRDLHILPDVQLKGIFHHELRLIQ